MLEQWNDIKSSLFEKMNKQRITRGQEPKSQEEIEKDYQKEYEKLWGFVPSRYEGASSDDIPEEVKKIIPFRTDTKNGMYLWGKVGVGKTHTLYALKEYYARKLMKLTVKNFTEYLQSIKATFDESYKKDILDVYEKDGMSFIAYDDIGTEKESEWAGEQVYRLVNYLYENGDPFIFTSNLSLKDLSNRFGEIMGDRIASRIAEMAHVVELKGSDRRV